MPRRKDTPIRSRAYKRAADKAIAKEEQLADHVIEYQLNKIDQCGDVSDLFEERMAFLAEEWGYELTECEDGIILPDGRVATLTFGVEIRERNDGEVAEEAELRNEDA